MAVSLKEALALTKPGWHKLVRRLYRRKPLFGTQVLDLKEKYGMLRVAVVTNSQRYAEFVCEIENESMRTCDICGKPGLCTEVDGWYATRCEVHRTKLVWRD